MGYLPSSTTPAGAQGIGAAATAGSSGTLLRRRLEARGQTRNPHCDQSFHIICRETAAGLSPPNKNHSHQVLAVTAVTCHTWQPPDIILTEVEVPPPSVALGSSSGDRARRSPRRQENEVLEVIEKQVGGRVLSTSCSELLAPPRRLQTRQPRDSVGRRDPKSSHTGAGAVP